MRVVCGVAHVFDDRGEEECEGVNGAKAGHANEHVDIHFPVTEGLVNVFDVEVIGEVAMVRLKAALDFGAFLVGEELSTSKVQ